MTDLAKAAKEYVRLHDKLRAEFPDCMKTDDQLQTTLFPCDTSTTEQIWLNFWQKPIRSSAKLKQGEKIVEKNSGRFEGIWKDMTPDNSPYEIIRVDKEKRVGSYSNKKNFIFAGDKAKEYASNPTIAKHRFLAIFNAGICFKKRHDKHGANPFPELVMRDDVAAFIASDGFMKIVRNFSKEFGFLWGPITVCHFLTDCGLSVKPDLHMIRTLKYIGLFPVDKSDNLQSAKKVVDVVRIVTQLCQEVYGEVTPENLRRFDLYLLRISEKFKLKNQLENNTHDI
ncbi:hypothetical protein MTBPR1_100055 [Candidatus Terasakiella magnetica]|uniref:Uncharacterized protein n=1 Tax=Candidatus Terasakiella magnetica TaxID=1867952 RepID=A0A1C3RDX6_9PROT|nr:hypothetical protein [Candidatus Terasakiella magnetica]SCA55414.1 hypothetical protein MTBPR1_100055 [Candidatus Terasakiella magnetica]